MSGALRSRSHCPSQSTHVLTTHISSPSVQFEVNKSDVHLLPKSARSASDSVRGRTPPITHPAASYTMQQTLEQQLSGMASADRVLIQVTKHGTRLVTELPPWKRNPQGLEIHEAPSRNSASPGGGESRSLKKRSSSKRSKGTSSVSVVTVPETATLPEYVATKFDAANQARRNSFNVEDVAQGLVSHPLAEVEHSQPHMGTVSGTFLNQSQLNSLASISQMNTSTGGLHMESEAPPPSQVQVPQSIEVVMPHLSPSLPLQTQSQSALTGGAVPGETQAEVLTTEWRAVPARAALSNQNHLFTHAPSAPPFLTTTNHNLSYTNSSSYPSSQSLPLAAIPVSGSNNGFSQQSSLGMPLPASVGERLPLTHLPQDHFPQGSNSLSLCSSLPTQQTSSTGIFSSSGVVKSPAHASTERAQLTASLPLTLAHNPHPLIASPSSTILTHQNPLINVSNVQQGNLYGVLTPPVGPVDNSVPPVLTDVDDTISLSSLRPLRPPKAKPAKTRRSKQVAPFGLNIGSSSMSHPSIITSPTQYSHNTFATPPWMSSPLGGPTLRLSSNAVPLQESARDVSRVIETPRATPMAVLLSLEGFKMSSEGAKTHVNQDRSFIHEVAPNVTVFAVFDGHGDQGHHVAQYVSNAFQQQLILDFPRPSSPAEMLTLSKSFTEAQILSWLRKNFTEIDRRLVESSGIDCVYSGCTASVALRFESSIIIAYVGDSKVAGFQFDGKKPYCLVETPEHSPSSKNEYRRIKQLGANVTEQYYQYFSKSISRIVEAGLSVSRSFGDIAARPYGLISEPDFVQFKIPPKKNRPGKKSYFPLMLVVASDGLWDTISPYEILDFVSNVQQSKDKLFESLKEIAEVAWRRRLAAEGRSDDTTAIIALLQ